MPPLTLASKEIENSLTAEERSLLQGGAGLKFQMDNISFHPQERREGRNWHHQQVTGPFRIFYDSKKGLFNACINVELFHLKRDELYNIDSNNFPPIEFISGQEENFDLEEMLVRYMNLGPKRESLKSISFYLALRNLPYRGDSMSVHCYRESSLLKF